MTDKELAGFIKTLKNNGYMPNPRVWDLSISWVEYEAGENFSVIYSVAPWLPLEYDLHPNG